MQIVSIFAHLLKLLYVMLTLALSSDNFVFKIFVLYKSLDFLYSQSYYIYMQQKTKKEGEVEIHGNNIQAHLHILCLDQLSKLTGTCALYRQQSIFTQDFFSISMEIGLSVPTNILHNPLVCPHMFPFFVTYPRLDFFLPQKK